MTQLGLDYASVDENAPPDFTKTYGAGARFAYLRKSFIQYNTSHSAFHLAADPHYARDAQHARDAGLVVGAYGFFSFHRNAPSAKEQVANLRQATGEIVPGVDLPPCVDVEFPGKGIQDTGRTPAQVFKFLCEIITEMRTVFGCAPMVYTSHVQWHDSNGLGGPNGSELMNCPLWIKTPYRLKAGQLPDIATPRVPHIGPAVDDTHDYWRVPLPWEHQGWWIQQYQGDAVGFAGFNKTIDLDLLSPLSATSHDTGRTSWLQRRLVSKGTSLTANGVWGADTEHALRAFQSVHGLTPDGIVGVKSFAALCW